MKHRPEDLQPDEIEIGGRVLITCNPHEANAEGILGTITNYRPGEGFFGCDLVAWTTHTRQPESPATCPSAWRS